MTAAEPDWAAQRERAVATHAADLARREQADEAEAAALLAAFVAAAREQDLAPVPLRARSYDGRHRYRTRLHGWYLRRDESVAVGEDGGFYVLSVPASIRARLSGATPTPTRPRLVLGAGGRDGERITLQAALARLLPIT